MTQLIEAKAADASAQRDGHLDLLRLVALIGVIIYQWFGWSWTPIAIPFAALTFTIAGALLAGSLDRSAAYPWTVLAKRVRRVVLPVWGLAAVAVPLMVWYGVAAGAGPGTGGAPDWQSMLLWAIPLFEPPSSAWGTAWTGSLWFVPAYLWLALIGPPLLWCFRKWPLRTAALPVLGLALALSGTWSPSSRVGEVLLTFALFGGYWLIGFAYHDNRLQRMSWTSVIILSSILMSAGLVGTLRAGDVTAASLAGLPVANSLWGAGAVILLLRLNVQPSARPHSTWVRTALAGVQGRALTIFLWSFPAFSISAALLVRYGSSPQSNTAAIAQRTAVAVGLIMVAVLLLGWLEDLADRSEPEAESIRHTARQTPGAPAPEISTAGLAADGGWGGGSDSDHRLGFPGRFFAAGLSAAYGSSGGTSTRFRRRSRRGPSPSSSGRRLLAELGRAVAEVAERTARVQPGPGGFRDR